MKGIIFKTIAGSRAYGTNVETSDTDYKGVYIQHPDEILGFGYKPQVEIGKDEVYYEVRRFLELAATANPNILELMYMPDDCIVSEDSAFNWILAYRDKFLTKKCLSSFGGYAVAQIRKARGLDKKMNWEADKVERKDVLDFCYIILPYEEGSLPVRKWLVSNNYNQELCGLSKIEHARDTYGIYVDYLAEMQYSNPKFYGGNYGYKGIIAENSNDVRLSEIPKFARKEGVLIFNKDGYSMHCKAYNEYQVWLESRNNQRFIDVIGHNQKIDGKNMLHCVRLIDMAKEIALNKTITVRRPDADYLLSIRKGEIDLNQIIDKAEADLRCLEVIYKQSDLPDGVNKDFVNNLLLKIRKEYARREL